MADFNSKVFSQKAECQREGRVPDGVVSPSSGPDMQGSLYSASFGFGCLSTANLFVQQNNLHITVIRWTLRSTQKSATSTSNGR